MQIFLSFLIYKYISTQNIKVQLFSTKISLLMGVSDNFPKRNNMDAIFLHHLNHTDIEKSKKIAQNKEIRV